MVNRGMTAAQLWKGDVIAQRKGQILGPNLAPANVAEISVDLPLAQLDTKTILAAVIWEVRVFIGLNNTGIERSVVLWRIGTDADGDTVTGSNTKFYNQPGTLIMDEHSVQGVTSGLSNWYLARSYNFPKGILCTTGKVHFWIDNQTSSAQSISGATGFSVEYTTIPVQAAEMLQALIVS